MMQRNEPIEACPRCKSVDHTQPKLLLINRGDPEQLGDGRHSWTSNRAFAVTDLKPEYAQPGSTGQFISGMFCERCGLGYVPESMAKPPGPKFRAVEGGWRRANEDGTLGPLLNCMADDPDSEDTSSAIRPNPVVAKEEVDWIAASRSGHELLQRHGPAANIIAAELAVGAQAEATRKRRGFGKQCRQASSHAGDLSSCFKAVLRLIEVTLPHGQDPTVARSGFKVGFGS